jgi:hypothetical protein
MWDAWERGETCTGFWWESPKENDHLKDQGVNGRMGSKWTLGRLVGGCGVDSLGPGQGSLAGSCECRDEPSGSGTMELVMFLTAGGKTEDSEPPGSKHSPSLACC